MTGVLALVGGDEFSPTCTFDRELLDAAGTDEVMILPTAAAYEHPGRYVERGIEHFASLGARAQGLDVLARRDALDGDNAASVRAAKCIYLVGGSAMHAKSVLMHSPVWDALVEAWNDGATVAGSAAGGQILCDPMVDSRGGAFTLGLGLISGVAVIPQRNIWSEDALHRTRALSGPDLALLGVDEGTAAIRSPEGTWHAAGSGSVVLHLGGHTTDLAELHR